MNADLTNTRIGWIVLRILAPTLLMLWGATSVWKQSMHIRGADVTGAAAIAYGSGVFLIGASLFLMPTITQIVSSKFTKETFIRFMLLLIAVVFLVSGSVIVLR